MTNKLKIEFLRNAFHYQIQCIFAVNLVGLQVICHKQKFRGVVMSQKQNIENSEMRKRLNVENPLSDHDVMSYKS